MGYASATSRLYQYVPDNVLQLGSTEFRRRIIYGNSWQRIRLGFLAAVTPNTTNDLSAVMCYFGLSSSIGPGVSAYNTQNFIGVSLIGQPGAGANLTYTAGTYPNPYYVRASLQAFGRYGNTNVTTTADTGQIVWSPLQLGNHRRFPYILDITRPTGGGGTYTISVYGVNNANISADHRPDHFFSCLDSTGVPVSNGITLTTLVNARTISWSELNGPLDTITLYWSKNLFPLEVSAIGAVLQDIGSYYTSTSTGTTYGGFVETWGGTIAHADAFGYGTLLSGTLTPYYATGPIVTSGSAANLAVYSGMAGTSLGQVEEFNAYSVGSVAQNGGTLNGGSNWGGAPFIYSW